MYPKALLPAAAMALLMSSPSFADKPPMPPGQARKLSHSAPGKTGAACGHVNPVSRRISPTQPITKPLKTNKVLVLFKRIAYQFPSVHRTLKGGLAGGLNGAGPQQAIGRRGEECGSRQAFRWRWSLVAQTR